MLEDWEPGRTRVAALDEQELISPELALVDPELAARARAALPARVSYLPAPPARALRLVVAELPSDGQPSGISQHPVLFAAAAFVAGAVAATAAWTLLPLSSDQSSPPPAFPSTTLGTASPAPTPPALSKLAPPHFTWPPVAGARSYRFEFLQAGTRIYAVVTTEPRQTLPLRWMFLGKAHRLGPGTYRWLVIPRLGAPGSLRDGDPVVDATYTI